MGPRPGDAPLRWGAVLTSLQLEQAGAYEVGAARQRGCDDLDDPRMGVSEQDGVEPGAVLDVLRRRRSRRAIVPCARSSAHSRRGTGRVLRRRSERAGDEFGQARGPTLRRLTSWPSVSAPRPVSDPVASAATGPPLQAPAGLATPAGVAGLPKGTGTAELSPVPGRRRLGILRRRHQGAGGQHCPYLAAHLRTPYVKPLVSLIG